MELVEQLPLIVETYQRQNAFLEQFWGYIGGMHHMTDIYRTEADAAEVLTGRDRASYEVGRADAYREVYEYLKRQEARSRAK